MEPGEWQVPVSARVAPTDALQGGPPGDQQGGFQAVHC